MDRRIYHKCVLESLRPGMEIPICACRVYLRAVVTSLGNARIAPTCVYCAEKHKVLQARANTAKQKLRQKARAERSIN